MDGLTMQQKGSHSCKLLASSSIHLLNQLMIDFMWFDLHILFHCFLTFPVCRGADKCYNQTLCEEHLNLTLPAKPPFHPRQFRRCAVVGNSGDLLKTQFGEEIDSHDAVIRDNEAPVNEVN